jgi:ribokinase
MPHKLSGVSQRILFVSGYHHHVTAHTATVVGQLARDLVLSVDEVPGAGSSAAARGRLEQLGGKGANQAVGLAQLGVRPGLVAVAGDDVIGDVLVQQARRDGIDVSGVVRRPGTLTGVIVEILAGGEYRYVEDLPLLTVADVEAAAGGIERRDAVLVQLQQPPDAAAAAARLGHAAGRLVVLDGAPGDQALLGHAAVVRADGKEAEQWLGVPPAEFGPAARDLLAKGPKLIALEVPGGNLFVWDGGELTVPLTDVEVVDTTGGGDAFVAALTASLLRKESYQAAARFATAAAGATVGHPGGRPDLRKVTAHG